ncbi:MAG TPA: plastocyanin/azurin family copper-binding protein [Candidatus Saccharimonadales bacterium]|nr:plastocyanin/azurin family copper-binding protein [Candidatus Saccharimonadales bacterium]
MKLWFVLACALFMLGSASSGPALTSNVAIRATGFSPAVDTIIVHDSVKWTNFDAVAHNCTSKANSSETWDSGSLGQGGAFTHTFDDPGSYAYQCGLNGSMQGTIVVISQSPVKAGTWGQLKQLYRGKAGWVHPERGRTVR